MPSAPTPLRLTREEFDAFLPERAGSAEAARVELAVGERMLGWGRSVARRLGDLELHARLVPRQDALRMALRRELGADSRTRERGAEPALAALVLIVGASGVEVALELPASAFPDIEKRKAALAEPGRSLELQSALEALPAPFTFGLEDERGEPTASLDGASFFASLDRSVVTGRALRIAWSVPRAVAALEDSLFDEQLAEALVALAAVLRLVTEPLGGEPAAAPRAAKRANARRARSRAHTELEPPAWEGRSRAWRMARAESRDEEVERASSSKVDGDGKKRREPFSAPLVTGSATEPGRPRLRAATRGLATEEVDARAPVARGARVRILAGPFAGRIGVVQDLDGKGGARVMLGLFATSVKVEDLIASVPGKGRPTLSSSHRKRLPAR